MTNPEPTTTEVPARDLRLDDHIIQGRPGARWYSRVDGVYTTDDDGATFVDVTTDGRIGTREFHPDQLVAVRRTNQR